MTRLRSKFIACLAFSIGGGLAVAQSISPPVAEYRGNKSEGAFEITNNTDLSLAVTLTLKSFKVEDGRVSYAPLDARITVQLGSGSFILRPHDSHVVYYKAVSTVTPVSFSIVPTLTPVVHTPGVNIGYIMPHMVYMYQKPTLNKSDVNIELAAGQLRVHNNSEKLGRVESIHGPKSELNGFPLYPGQTWTFTVPDPKVTVTFKEGFKIDTGTL